MNGEAKYLGDTTMAIAAQVNGAVKIATQATGATRAGTEATAQAMDTVRNMIITLILQPRAEQGSYGSREVAIWVENPMELSTQY